MPQFGTGKDSLSRAEKNDFETLCLEHGGYVLGLMRNLMGNRADAEDLAQEVMVIALRRFERGEKIGSPKAWFYAISIRVAANARRTRWFRGVFGASERPDELVDWKTPDRAFEAREARAILHRLLDGLKEKKRTVFVLHELEGLTCPEIAEIVKCPLPTVYARLFHARTEVVRAAKEMLDHE